MRGQRIGDALEGAIVRWVTVAPLFFSLNPKMSADPPYRIDLINAAMGAQRLTNEHVAEKASVGVTTVSRIRNGDPNVMLITLKKVVEAVGLTVAEVVMANVNKDAC
jgi:hypothetical protein